MTVELSAGEARRLALRAQGFTDRAPAKPGLAHLRKLAARQHAIQIDSVNVLVRAHYVPAFSRLGPYPVDLLDSLTYERRELFEYIAHAACLVPTALHPLLRWRMDVHAAAMQAAPPERLAYTDKILAEIAERGALSAAELTDPGKRSGNWWGWADGKATLEWLYRAGKLAVSGRRGFERVYDLAERVIPPGILAAPAPAADEAQRELLVLAARALGVGTAKDLSTYFNLQAFWERPKLPSGRRAPSPIPSLLASLVEEGQLAPARVEGWKQPAFMDPQAKIPRSVDARALVSPFDPLVWERDRPLRLFGFDYTIEIYVPAIKRVHGYYVLPFLLGDTFAGRVDLKADRKRSTLLVPGAFLEAGHDPRHVAAELATELARMAAWLRLERIEVGERGDLAKTLAREVGARPAI